MATVTRLLADSAAIDRMRVALNPFGAGRAASCIVDVLQHDLDHGP